MTTPSLPSTDALGNRESTTANYLNDRGSELNISPHEAADQLGMSVAVWNQTLKGRVKIAFDRIDLIAQLLQSSTHQLLTQELSDYCPALLELLGRWHRALSVKATLRCRSCSSFERLALKMGNDGRSSTECLCLDGGASVMTATTLDPDRFSVGSRGLS